MERGPQGDCEVRKPISERACVFASIQSDAIDRAREFNSKAAIHVERIRHTTGGSPDKWRKP